MNRHLNYAAVIEDAEWIAQHGGGIEEAARRLDFSNGDMLDKYLRRRDRPDLVRRLTANTRQELHA